MNREQMHSLGWLVSANSASSELFSKPVSSISVLCGLSFGFLRLSQSNPAESLELETHEGTPRVNPMRHAEHGDCHTKCYSYKRWASCEQFLDGFLSIIA